MTPHSAIPNTEGGGELLPCPFCGGTRVQAIEYAGAVKDYPSWWVGCTVCDAGVDGETKALAVDSWNIRADPMLPAIVAESERLKTRAAALDELLTWIAYFADVRSRDDSKVFARVNRGALRTIRDKALEAVGIAL